MITSVKTLCARLGPTNQTKRKETQRESNKQTNKQQQEHYTEFTQIQFKWVFSILSIQIPVSLTVSVQ